MALLDEAKKKKAVVDLLAANDVSRFVELMLSAPLNRREKVKLTIFWRRRHDVTQQQIIHARNRITYYRTLKNKNAAKKLAAYNEQYNYADRRTRWTEAKLKKFLELNNTHKAREIARILSCSIPAIQSLRRKLKLIDRIGVTDLDILAGLKKSEKELREGVKKW